MKYYICERDFKYENPTYISFVGFEGEPPVANTKLLKEENWHKNWQAKLKRAGLKLNWHYSFSMIVSEAMRDALRNVCSDDVFFKLVEVEGLDYPVYVLVPHRFVPLNVEYTKLDFGEVAGYKVDWADEFNWIVTPLGRRIKKFSHLWDITVNKEDVGGWQVFLLDDDTTGLIVSEDVKTVIEGFDFIEVRFEEIRVVG